MSSANASGATPGGLLFKFPPELRLRIYEMVFPLDSIDIFTFENYLI